MMRSNYFDMPMAYSLLTLRQCPLKLIEETQFYMSAAWEQYASLYNVCKYRVKPTSNHFMETQSNGNGPQGIHEASIAHTVKYLWVFHCLCSNISLLEFQAMESE